MKNFIIEYNEKHLVLFLLIVYSSCGIVYLINHHYIAATFHLFVFVLYSYLLYIFYKKDKKIKNRKVMQDVLR